MCTRCNKTNHMVYIGETVHLFALNTGYVRSYPVSLRRLGDYSDRPVVGTLGEIDCPASPLAM